MISRAQKLVRVTDAAGTIDTTLADTQQSRHPTPGRRTVSSPRFDRVSVAYDDGACRGRARCAPGVAVGYAVGGRDGGNGVRPSGDHFNFP
jgi:hypothetical protein